MSKTLVEQLTCVMELQRAGRLEEAGLRCLEILRERPGQTDALYLLGSIELQLGRPERARASYDQVLVRQPDHLEARHDRGVLSLLQGRFAEARMDFETVLARQPKRVSALSNLGYVLQMEGRHEAALGYYERALRQQPGLVELWNNRGLVLMALGRAAEALASYERALARRPGFAEAHYNRGLAMQSLGRLGEALASYDQALNCKPGYAEAYSDRATVLRALDRLGEAQASCDRALALAPAYAVAHNNRGVVLQDLGNPAEALACYARAVELDPHYADAHWNKSLCHLLLGDYARGWAEYEWRWRKADAETRRPYAQPLWLGQDNVQGKTVLLTAEQGMGDTLQFCRYVPELVRQGARVILEVQPPLQRLLSRLDGAPVVMARGASLPTFDFQCPLMSLPLAFGTRLETAPATVPYLAAGAESRQRWAERLGAGTAMKVGLVWSGYAGFKNDRNRSVALDLLLPLQEARIRLISLQKEMREGDQTILQRHPAIENMGETLEDFEDTAGLIENLDLVISADTAVAHLAGALGKPVWILLPYAPDWRWLLNREDSPWYPTARLFRQPSAGDWASVVRAVITALAQLEGVDQRPIRQR